MNFFFALETETGTFQPAQVENEYAKKKIDEEKK